MPESDCTCPVATHDGEDGCGLPLDECTCKETPTLGAILGGYFSSEKGSERLEGLLDRVEDLADEGIDFVRSKAGKEAKLGGPGPKKAGGLTAMDGGKKTGAGGA